MKHRERVLFVGLFFIIGIPAYGYGDPSGGALFQFLMPLLAGIWATWLIAASRIRREVASFVRKLRRSQSSER